MKPLRELRPEIDTFGTVPATALARLHLDPEDPVPALTDDRLLNDLPPRPWRLSLGLRARSPARR